MIFGDGRFELSNQNLQRNKAMFVPSQKLTDFGWKANRKVTMAQGDFALGWNVDAEELVAFTVLPFTGFEKPNGGLSAFGIRGSGEVPRSGF